MTGDAKPSHVTVPIGTEGDRVKMISYYAMPYELMMAALGDPTKLYPLLVLAMGPEAHKLAGLTMREGIAFTTAWATVSNEAEGGEDDGPGLPGL